MQLQLASDLHIEFERNVDYFKYAENLYIPNRIDLIVLAGDICTYKQIADVMPAFCEVYPQVVYVNGNHESWGTTFKELRGLKEGLESVYKNFHWLTAEDGVVEIEGKKFLGDTMWFTRTDFTGSFHSGWIDYRRICEQFPKQAIFDRNEAFVKAVIENTGKQKIDVVVTHHLPSYKSCDPFYEGDSTNAFYANNFDYMVSQLNSRFWFHGHTHKSCGYWINNTQVICNPHGYPHEDFKTVGWDPACIFTI